ncbi:O-fucosyltransferase 34, partial [Bienertia sinuspersici]
NRLVNNGIPIDVQKFRCRVNYRSLRFTPTLEKLGKRIVQLLRSKGPFLALHLRLQRFSSGGVEFNEVRISLVEGEGDKRNKKRVLGRCPLTPEETLLTLKALGVDPNIQLYIAAGHIHGGQTGLAPLLAYFPNLVKKETLLQYEELSPFTNHSSQMAAIDYMVSLESDIFVATYGGNMAKLVEGHRRYLGYRTTINLERRALIKLIDAYKNGFLCWDEFSQRVKFVHKDRMGNPKARLQNPGKPKLEDYFYINPQEYEKNHSVCLTISM